MYRKAFTDEEDLKMIIYWEQQLKKGNEDAKTPLGNLIWEQFILDGNSDRSASSLTSHFRKHIMGNDRLFKLEIPSARLLNIFRLWGTKINDDLKMKIENYTKCTLYCTRDGKLKQWRNNGGQKRKAPVKEEEEMDLEEAFIEDASSNSGNQGTTRNVAAGTKNEEESEENSTQSMAAADEFNFTQELQDLKKQVRVRHSVREWLGYPPITAPPKTKKRRSFEEELPADISFEDEDLIDISSERSAQVQATPPEEAQTSTEALSNLHEGQGNEIHSVQVPVETQTSSTAASREAQTASCTKSTPKISEEFRKKAVEMAFERLKKTHSISNDFLPEFKRREALLKGDLKQLDYMEKLVALAEELVTVLKTVKSPFKESTTGSSKLKLARIKHSKITPEDRITATDNLLKEFSENAPDSCHQHIRKALTQQEPLFVTTSDTIEDYLSKISTLRDNLWGEIGKLYM